MAWTLTFFLVLGVILVLAVLWIGCIIDVVTRPDLRVLTKGLWVLAVLFLPIIGSVVYLVTRPKNKARKEEEEDEIWGQAPDSFPTTWNDAADTITKPYQQR